MGYPWLRRLGYLGEGFFDREECSALFILWLEAVHVLMLKNKTAFQFSEGLLLTISKHLFSFRFGNFLTNNLQEAKRMGFPVLTVTVTLTLTLTLALALTLTLTLTPTPTLTPIFRKPNEWAFLTTL